MAYSVLEVCEIIKACRKHGVTEFSIADLKLQLAHQEPQTLETRPARLTKDQQKKADEAEQKMLEENERELRLAELENLKLADPLAYEELIASGELEHAGEEPSGLDG